MSEFHNQSRASARGSDYVWRYEYYDDEEPVSFEGLSAHRHSIVIGFWVGLAVFVIFMFFVLTLLTKTGAPHQDNPELAEKRTRLGNAAIDSPAEEPVDKAFARPQLEESRSFFHFYISEEEQGGELRQGPKGPEGQTTGARRGRERPSSHSSCGLVEMAEVGRGGHAAHPLQELPEEDALGRDNGFLSHFNIPNFVNSEPSSMLGEDDLLLCEPPISQDRQSHTEEMHRIIS
ncbi:melanocortin-2 receptor accessory protein 2B-like [Aplochiton taeniatus]